MSLGVAAWIPRSTPHRERRHPAAGGADPAPPMSLLVDLHDPTTSPALDAASSAVAISLLGRLLLLTMLPRYNGCWNLPTPSARPGRRCPGVVVPGTRRGSRMGNQRASSAGSRSVLVQPRCPVPSPPSRPVTAPSGRPSPPRPHPPGERPRPGDLPHQLPCLPWTNCDVCTPGQGPGSGCSAGSAPSPRSPGPWGSHHYRAPGAAPDGTGRHDPARSRRSGWTRLGSSAPSARHCCADPDVRVVPGALIPFAELAWVGSQTAHGFGSGRSCRYR